MKIQERINELKKIWVESECTDEAAFDEAVDLFREGQIAVLETCSDSEVRGWTSALESENADRLFDEHIEKLVDLFKDKF